MALHLALSGKTETTMLRGKSRSYLPAAAASVALPTSSATVI
jgi:hypothetical protein